MGYHAKISPSGAKKWLACPGSLAMEQGIPNEASEASDEGTAAHWLAAQCLTTAAHPAGYIGRLLRVKDGEVSAEPGEGGRVFTVDVDLAGAVNAFVQAMRGQAALPGAVLFVEVDVPIDHITGEKDATGRADAIVAIGDELQIHDYKHGQGVRVSARDNPQLRMYALGALRKYGLLSEFKTVRCVIHQPRAGGVSEDVIETSALQSEIADALVAGAKLATTALEFADNWKGKTTEYLVPGDHCSNSFCRARASCPALRAKVEEQTGLDFDVIPTPGAGPSAPAIPSDFTALGRAGAWVDAVEDWCRQIRRAIEKALIETSNSPAAIDALGFKLVEGKRGARAWGDPGVVESILRKKRMKVEEIFDFSLKSPTAIEKAIADEHPKWWSEVAEHVMQKKGKPSVQPVSDERPPLALTPTADTFDVLPEKGGLI